MAATATICSSFGHSFAVCIILIISSLTEGLTQVDWSNGVKNNGSNLSEAIHSTQGPYTASYDEIRGAVGKCYDRRKPEYELIRKLLNGYDKNVRPIRNKREAIEVKFDVAYNQLVDLDGKKQILTSKVWVRQFWNNSFLTWNKTDYCGIATIQLNPKLIWKPDVVLYNSIGVTASGEMYNFKTMIILHSDGRNEWYAPTEIKSICRIDIAYFPFDYQNCILKFGSWTHSSSMLNFIMNRPGTADLSMYRVNGEWTLLGVPGSRNSVNYSCCKDSFLDITYNIRLERRVLFYLNNLVIPNLILAALVICSFYVPPESGERISLNITVMLGLTVFLLLFNERIPPTSEQVPLIGAYYFALFYLVGISMILTCVTSRCYHHNPFQEMPTWFRFLIFRVLARLLRMPKMKTATEDEPEASTDPYFQPNWSPNDPNCNKHGLLIQSRQCNGSLRKPRGESELSATPSFDGNHLETTKLRANDPVERKMGEISTQLQQLIDYVKKKNVLETKKDEWHFASLVLDKLFFWLFIASILLTTVVFYVRTRNSSKKFN